jgi:methionyl-tRNA synthetase
MIIAKVLNNPRIDKKTLLQKFISKIEMESNIGAGLSDELSQIKKMINRDREYSIESVELIGGDNLQHHAVSHLDQVN